MPVLPILCFCARAQKNIVAKFKGVYLCILRFCGMFSNQIIFIGLRSSKNYYKRPGGGVGIWEGSLGCEFFAWVDVC